MNLRNASAFLLSAALLFTVGASDAEAGKKKKSDDSDSSAAAEMIEIAETGVSAFDEVFNQVKDIHTTLDEATATITSAETNLLTALGAAEGTPLADALAEFKASAGDMVTLEMDGTTPNFSVNPEAPENVTAGVEGLKGAVADIQTVITNLSELPPKVTALIDASKSMPAEAPAALKDAGLAAKDIMPAVKTVKNNVKATAQTPDRVTSTTSAATGLLSTITGAFTSGE
jgi:hypothetical protein